MTFAKRQVRRDDRGVTHETTDLRNAERFVDMHGGVVRYIHAWGKWLIWTGTHWRVADSGEALRLAAQTSRVMVAETETELDAARKRLDEAEKADDDRAKTSAKRAIAAATRLFQWACKSQSAPRLHAMLDLARAHASIAIRHEALDTDPLLFNVENGTIDLRLDAPKRLRPHDPADLITKIAPVAYDENATCPTWDAFLHHAQAGNEEMLSFLRRSRGYMLTGLTTEHALFFFFGPTGTGKSTYFITWTAALGDYAVRAPRKLLMATKGERHPTELTTLFGARTVFCSEVEEGSTLDEALVKDLTGGEAITAHRMREDDWTFQPTHKLAIPGNHKPQVRNFDDAIRRRMRVVPFVVKPQTVDKQLPERLRAELPGILADAVRGCLEWQRDGLGEPVAVREATDKYQEESDVLGEFFRLHATFDDKAATVARKAIRTAYEEYARENGMTPVGAKRFAAKLRAHGVTETKVRLSETKTADGWRGVRLLTPLELVSKAAACSDVLTCSDQVQVDRQSQKRLSREQVIPDPISTSQHVSTTAVDDEPYYDDDGHAFSDLIDDGRAAQ